MIANQAQNVRFHNSEKKRSRTESISTQPLFIQQNQFSMTNKQQILHFSSTTPSFSSSPPLCPQKLSSTIIICKGGDKDQDPLSVKTQLPQASPQVKRVNDIPSISQEQLKNLDSLLLILNQIKEDQRQYSGQKEEILIWQRKREIRLQKIERYREKKLARKWDFLRYEVRKSIAKNRLRCKGRFMRE